MHSEHIIFLMLAVTTVASAATDYRQITTFTGPCARELAVMAREGDIDSAREQARALCRTEAGRNCPDLWLIYAYCEMELNRPGALAVCEDVARRLPNSAAAHMIHAYAILKDEKSNGLLRIFSKMKRTVQALEKALECDADCHAVRVLLAIFYSMSKVLGGDTSKLDYHLAELARRDPFHAALANGQIEAQWKNYSASVPYFQEAIRLDSQDSQPVLMLITSKAAMGEYVEAFALCAEIKPAFVGDRTDLAALVELSAQTLLHGDEALAASREYLQTAKGVTPQMRARVLAQMSIILKAAGRISESEHHLVLARREWKNVDEYVQKFVKKHHSQRGKLGAS